MSQAQVESDTQTPPAQGRPWVRLCLWAICLGVLAWAAFAGIRYQHACWDMTEPIRFPFDIQNAYNQGRRAHDQGILNVYDNASNSATTRPDGVREYALDYPPLRLVTAWLWYDWTVTRFGENGWQNTYEFHQPLLIMNRIVLAIAALAAMGLVLHVSAMNRPQPALPTGKPSFRLPNPLSATIAALFVWFSPPATLLGFGWPQWDIIVPAFFLLSLLAACRRFWFIAGLVLAVGALYKGQLLLSLPMFLIWPLAAGKWRMIPRFIAGFVIACLLITSPFMLHNGSISGESWNWLRVGWLFGSQHFQAMTMGSTSNLPAILSEAFRVHRPDLVAFTLPDCLSGCEVAWGTLLRTIFMVGAIACSIAMGVHDRRHDRRFLLAAITPWLLFVTVCAQVHERYPLYPALMATTFVALGLGWTIAAISLQGIAFLPILQDMLSGGDRSQFLASVSPGLGDRLYSYVASTHPGLGWALIMLTCVCLFASLNMRRSDKPVTSAT